MVDDRDVESLVWRWVAHEEPEDPTPTVQLGTQALRRGLESYEVNLSEV